MRPSGTSEHGYFIILLGYGWDGDRVIVYMKKKKGLSFRYIGSNAPSIIDWCLGFASKITQGAGNGSGYGDKDWVRLVICQ